MNTKVCNLCKKELPATIEHFHVRKPSPDGLSYTCRPCARTRAAAYTALHPKSKRPIPKSDHRFCSCCKNELPATAEYFYTFTRKERPGKLYFTSQCKACSAIVHRIRYQSQPPKQSRAILNQLHEEDSGQRISLRDIPLSSTPIEKPSRGRPSSKSCGPEYLKAEQLYRQQQVVVLPNIPGLY